MTNNVYNKNEVRLVQAASGVDLDARTHEVGAQDEHWGLQGQARQPSHSDYSTCLPQVWPLWSGGGWKLIHQFLSFYPFPTDTSDCISCVDFCYFDVPSRQYIWTDSNSN